MKIDLSESIAIPSGVSVNEKHGEFHVKGPKGEVTRRLFHPKMNFTVQGDAITVSSKNATKREKTQFYTTVAHVKNVLRGVTEGFTYKLKICSGHFPMSVAIKGDIFEVKNFIGEAVPRKLKLNPKTKVVIDGAIVTVEGIDVEETGQQAARIERLCKRPGFDKRIFQDGIYITHKGDQAL